MDTPEDVDRLVGEWSTRVTERARRFQIAQESVATLSVTESAANGAIRVTVGPSGIPTDIWLSDDTGRMRPAEVARQLMACMRRAQAGLADRVGAVMAETVGDSADAAAVVDAYHQRFPQDDPAPPSEAPTRLPQPVRTPAREDEEEWDTPW
ncbi:YbaB/EbfC family nucleoid-associated protein [Actinocrispum wychmicini]|uniref:YbaB/EbfC DNA-binding family protein n=1 Tax=Actinocrispum wychmicini TaxID=1213861 RepID=A0A4R2JHX4_9PSEU|nr:YbaB/EbfC family nucleoid-associated protein [Actinocrispum wychmicini]TCO56009.1 YbaB/EbfC DNA-binding family protein [Actinocrispum wychmicini]